jgi:hypothetical protein
MLESMPGCTTVNVWPSSESFRYFLTWLVWRRGTVSQSLTVNHPLSSDRAIIRLASVCKRDPITFDFAISGEAPVVRSPGDRVEDNAVETAIQ